MRLVINIIIFIIVLLVGIVIFMPKSQLYFLAEKYLNNNYGIIIEEKLKETPINLAIEDAKVYAQGLEVVYINSIKIDPYIILNRVVAKDIELAGVAKDFMNISIEKAILKESILKPFIVDVKANGSFGVAKGWIDLKRRLLHIDIIDVKNINPIKKYLHKNQKGWYYESKF